MQYKSFKETIENSEDIVIFSHVNPDGDTLGSMVALNQVIKENYGKNPVMVYAGNIPEIYEYLPDIKEAVPVAEIDKNKVYSLAISVDVAAKDRMVEGLAVFENAKMKMNIDHHKTNNNFGDVNFVDGEASCCGEVLLDIFEALDLKINKSAAVGLYTAFLTDTGGFRYENTNARTLQKAGRVIELGANPAEIARLCYESKPKPMVMLNAYCLSNACFELDNKIAYVCITDADLEKFGASKEHTEGIVEELRRIKTTEVSFVLKEVDENTVKASLRSKIIDVSKVACVFGGGGHTFAAGCTIRKPLSIAKDKILEQIKIQMNECL